MAKMAYHDRYGCVRRLGSWEAGRGISAEGKEDRI